MNEHVAELGWTDEQWSRICRAVSEEAQRSRVSAKFLPIYGPVDPSEVAVANIRLTEGNAPGGAGAGIPPRRLEVDSTPDTEITKITSLVYVRTHEARDPELQAVLSMFRRAASVVARTEDALMFNGLRTTEAVPQRSPVGTGGNLQVVSSPSSNRDGLLPRSRAALAANLSLKVQVSSALNTAGINLQRTGTDLVTRIIEAINALDNAGYSAPYACILAKDLYQAVHTPTSSLVLPRHTIMPMLEGGSLLRAGQIRDGWGVVVAYESGQVEQVLASDITVKLLQISLEPRCVFRVSERVALRIKDPRSLAVLHP